MGATDAVGGGGGRESAHRWSESEGNFQGAGVRNTELVVGTSFGPATITFKRTTQDCQIQIC